MRECPRACIMILALFGDLIRRSGWQFPIYTDRYNNMITENRVPINRTIAEVGEAPIGLDQALDETCKYYLENYS